MYKLKSTTGGETMTVKRKDKNTLEFEIGGKKVVAFTEDLAFLVREELPKDRADEMFAEIEEKAISKGKARVCVKAHKRIEKGDDVIFTLDITKYLDARGNPTGVRTTNFGFIY